MLYRLNIEQSPDTLFEYASCAHSNESSIRLFINVLRSSIGRKGNERHLFSEWFDFSWIGQHFWSRCALVVIDSQVLHMYLCFALTLGLFFRPCVLPWNALGCSHRLGSCAVLNCRLGLFCFLVIFSKNATHTGNAVYNIPVGWTPLLSIFLNAVWKLGHDRVHTN